MRRDDPGQMVGYQTKEGGCLWGYAIGHGASTLRRPCHMFQQSSEFARNLVKSSLGGGSVDAFSGMLGHMALLREFFYSLRGPAARHGGAGRLRKPFHPPLIPNGHNREAPGKTFP